MSQREHGNLAVEASARSGVTLRTPPQTSGGSSGAEPLQVSMLCLVCGTEPLQVSMPRIVVGCWLWWQRQYCSGGASVVAGQQASRLLLHG